VLSLLLSRQFTNDDSIDKNGNSIGDLHNFGRVARVKKDDQSQTVQASYDVVNLLAGSNIDTASRIVEQQQRGVASSHLANTTFC
jgi:hypothetical protein